MSTLEDAGRVIDREMEKLREFFEKEVRPTTQRRAIEALRAAATRLSQLADQLDEIRPEKASS